MKKIGDKGEKIAEFYLKNKGFKIIDRKYKKAGGEIDLVTLSEKDNQKEIHFIEVKYIENSKKYLPEYNFDRKKYFRIYQTARKYMNENKIISRWFIDLVSIRFDRVADKYKIKFFEKINFS